MAKGSVENLVGWVKGSFFKQRRFLDREDLERQLREWLTEVNTVRPSRATGIVPAVRLAEEQTRLRPLKIAPTDLALRIPVSVGPTGVVLHDGHPYSMPPDATGLPGTLYLYRDRVRIIAGRFSAEHVRQWRPGDGSILPEHRAQRVAAVSGKRARRLQRQHLIDLGPAALAYLTELTHRRTRTWVHDVKGHSIFPRRGHRKFPTPVCACDPDGSVNARNRRRAGGVKAAPKAPAGAERSGAPGRARARRHPLAASEAGHDAAG